MEDRSFLDGHGRREIRNSEPDGAFWNGNRLPPSAVEEGPMNTRSGAASRAMPESVAAFPSVTASIGSPELFTLRRVRRPRARAALRVILHAMLDLVALVLVAAVLAK
jgi:hypothetical protein